MPTEMSTMGADGRYIYCYCKEDKGGILLDVTIRSVPMVNGFVLVV